MRSKQPPPAVTGNEIPGGSNTEAKDPKDTMPPPPQLPGKTRKREGRSVPKTGASEPVMAAAQAALQGIQQASPSAVWKGAFREQEVNARVKKAAQSITELDQFQGTLGAEGEAISLREDVRRLSGQLSDYIDAVPSLRETVSKLRGKKALEMLQDAESHSEIEKTLKCPGMDADTLSSMILFIGQKVVEARGLSVWGACPGELAGPSPHAQVLDRQ